MLFHFIRTSSYVLGKKRKILLYYSKKIERPISLGSKEENPWSSTESSGYGSMDSAGKVTRILVPKANSFGGTQTFVLQHSKSPMRGGSLSKAGKNNSVKI